MKLLNVLIWFIRIFGGLLAVIMTISLFLIIIPIPKTFPEPQYNIPEALIGLLVGIVWLIVAVGLSKKRKWAWYLGVSMFIYSIIHNFIIGSTINIIAGIIGLILLIILIKEKKVIFEQSVTDKRKKDMRFL